MKTLLCTFSWRISNSGGRTDAASKFLIKKNNINLLTTGHQFKLTLFNEGDTKQFSTVKPVALGFQNELEFGNVGFWGGRKDWRNRRKTLGIKTRTNDKLNPHMTLGPGIEPRPHWWEVSALTTVPSRSPKSYKVVITIARSSDCM